MVLGKLSIMRTATLEGMYLKGFGNQIFSIILLNSENYIVLKVYDFYGYCKSFLCTKYYQVHALKNYDTASIFTKIRHTELKHYTLFQILLSNIHVKFFWLCHSYSIISVTFIVKALVQSTLVINFLLYDDL